MQKFFGSFFFGLVNICGLPARYLKMTRLEHHVQIPSRGFRLGRIAFMIEERDGTSGFHGGARAIATL